MPQAPMTNLSNIVDEAYTQGVKSLVCGVIIKGYDAWQTKYQTLKLND